jgi:hypothetical protein
MDSFKITLMCVNHKIKSKNLDSTQLYIFQKLLEREFIEDLNIKLVSIRKNFVDFVSTNEKTINQNIYDYYNEENNIKHFENFQNKLLKELELVNF